MTRPLAPLPTLARPRDLRPGRAALRARRPQLATWLLMMLAVVTCQLGCGESGSATAAGSTSGTGGGEPFAPANHRAWPKMERVGDGVMKSPRVVLIVPDNESGLAKNRLPDFVNALPDSEWYAAWTPGVGVGAARPSRTIPGPPLDGPTVDDTQGSAYIDAALAAAADPTLDPDGESIYVVTFPLGVRYWTDTEPRLLGRHASYGSLGDGWAFAQRYNLSDTLDQLTAVVSHEIAEAMTNTAANGWQVRIPPGANPWEASAWAAQEGVDDQGRGYLENGDFCTATNFKDAEGRNFQRIYDNAAAAAGGDPCVPAVPDPYFNVSTSHDWYAVEAGRSVVIDVNGWTAAPASDFRATVAGFAVGIQGATFDLQAHLSGASDTFNNRIQGTLQVDVPSGNASGGWGVISIWTEGASIDDAHLFAVGVHVP